MDRRDARFVIIRNIEHYQRLLATELEIRARDTIVELLSEARRDLEMHDRDGAA
jgi:hypothetical protein